MTWSLSEPTAIPGSAQLLAHIAQKLGQKHFHPNQIVGLCFICARLSSQQIFRKKKKLKITLCKLSSIFLLFIKITLIINLFGIHVDVICSSKGIMD